MPIYDHYVDIVILLSVHRFAEHVAVGWVQLSVQCDTFIPVKIPV
jgi:hypothetical protein